MKEKTEPRKSPEKVKQDRHRKAARKPREVVKGNVARIVERGRQMGF